MARETAAAAIAVRGEGDAVEVCIVAAGENQWSVPWALIGRGEVPKQTALRALAEGTGVRATLTDVDPRFYKTIEQVYRRGIDKVRREVHFFLVRAKPDAGSQAWVPAAEALQRITSKSVREVLEAALRPAGAAQAQPSPAQPAAGAEPGGPA